MAPPSALQGENSMDLRGEISTTGAFRQTAGREEEEEDSAIKGGKTQERDTELSQYNKPKCAFVMSCDETSLKFEN